MFMEPCAWDLGRTRYPAPFVPEQQTKRMLHLAVASCLPACGSPDGSSSDASSRECIGPKVLELKWLEQRWHRRHAITQKQTRARMTQTKADTRPTEFVCLQKSTRERRTFEPIEALYNRVFHCYLYAASRRSGIVSLCNQGSGATRHL